MLTQDEFGIRLRTLRKQHNLTLTELAEMIGNISYTAIASWEKGQKSPSFFHVMRLCDVLDISVDELLGLSEKKTSSPSPAVTIGRSASTMWSWRGFWRRLCAAKKHSRQRKGEGGCHDR